jgi:hypothetical protein
VQDGKTASIYTTLYALVLRVSLAPGTDFIVSTSAFGDVCVRPQLVAAPASVPDPSPLALLATLSLTLILALSFYFSLLIILTYSYFYCFYSFIVIHPCAAPHLSFLSPSFLPPERFIFVRSHITRSPNMAAASRESPSSSLSL